MRWMNCPALWTVLAADGEATEVTHTPVRMGVVVHDDDSATVSFRTQSDELVVMTGTKRFGDVYHLTTATPHFEGNFVVLIDTLRRIATGLLRKNSLVYAPPWLAKVDIFLEASDNER